MLEKQFIIIIILIILSIIYLSPICPSFLPHPKQKMILMIANIM